MTFLFFDPHQPLIILPALVSKCPSFETFNDKRSLSCGNRYIWPWFLRKDKDVTLFNFALPQFPSPGHRWYVENLREDGFWVWSCRSIEQGQQCGVEGISSGAIVNSFAFPLQNLCSKCNVILRSIVFCEQNPFMSSVALIQSHILFLVFLSALEISPQFALTVAVYFAEATV